MIDEEDWALVRKKQKERRGKHALSEEEKLAVQEEVSYMPIAGSTYRFNLGEEEKQTIDELRQWSLNYFRDNYVFELENTIPEGEVERDFDLIGRIISILDIDDVYSDIKLRDITGK